MDAAILHINLFGELELRLGGASLPPLESARARSLLGYLLLNRNAHHPRQRIAFILWPDSRESQARTNLRHLLFVLKRALPALDPFLDVRTSSLGWRADSAFRLDVAEFQAALARAGEGGRDELADLREAVELYRGDILEGCYDEWIEPERERLRRRYLQALERLTRLLASGADKLGAVAYAERLLLEDPLDEASYRLLMRLHAERGDRPRALRIYQRCVAALEHELGVEPSAATHELYEALRPTAAGAIEIDSRGQRESAPIVGRVSEWERLSALWRETERGSARLVLVTGEAGIGKTRIVEELRSWCARRGAATAEARAYRAEGSLAYGPVTTWLRSPAIRQRLPHFDRRGLREVAHLLPELLHELPELPAPQPLPEREQRARLFDSVARAILGSGDPLLLIADDIQWFDPESLQLLHHLLRIGADAPLLVAATARREELHVRHPLNELILGLQLLERFDELELARLGAEETAVLAERIGGRPFDAPDAARLFAETEGNPLFVIEALRAGWRRGDSSRGWSSPRVQAVIQYRLGQLGEPARELAGIAATIGREFTMDVLGHAAGSDAESLVRSLDELWQARIIREQGARAYDFSHDKIREVAYLGMSSTRRRHFHRSVAQALERVHARDPGRVSGQIAGHYDSAGLAEEAITWYEAAAEAAQRLYSSGEATRLLSRALELVETLPAALEHQARELAILTSLLTPVASIEGFASPRLEALHRRALEVADRLAVDAPPQLLRSLAVASLSRDDFDTAHRFGAQLQARARADSDGALLVESDYLLGIAAFWQGELEAARRHFEAAIADRLTDRRRSHLLRYWLDPQVVCLSRLGNTLWFLGDPAAAARARDRALALADEVDHPNSRAAALVFAAWLAIEMEDTALLRRYVSTLIDLEDDQPSRPTQVAADLLREYLRVLDGEVTAGITVIRNTLDTPTGAEHAPGMRAMIARLLLAACAEAGDVRGRLDAAERMLRMSGAARLWEAVARLARAECLAVLGAPEEEIEAELQCALEVARRQGARMLELRAAEALAKQRKSEDSPPRSRARASERGSERLRNAHSPILAQDAAEPHPPASEPATS